MSAENLSVIVLAGGESSRMGEDKKFVRLKGKTFLEIALEKAGKLGSEIVLSIGEGEKEKVEKYTAIYTPAIYTLKIVEDKKSFQGPLFGVTNALEKAEGKYVALLPVDAPLVREKFYEEITNEIKNKLFEGIALKLEKTEPLFGVYEKNAFLNACQKAKTTKNKGLREALEFMKIKYIGREEIEKMNLNAASFASINTKKELESLNDKL